MKSAEEILKTKTNKFISITQFDLILEAMDEYAAQFISKEKCDHRFSHLRTVRYYKPEKYTNSFFLTDFYFCERCLEEKEVKKVAHDVSIYADTPDWALGTTKKGSID